MHMGDSAVTETEASARRHTRGALAGPVPVAWLVLAMAVATIVAAGLSAIGGPAGAGA